MREGEKNHYSEFHRVTLGNEPFLPKYRYNNFRYSLCDPWHFTQSLSSAVKLCCVEGSTLRNPTVKSLSPESNSFCHTQLLHLKPFVRGERVSFLIHTSEKKKSRKPKGQRMMICKCLAKIRVQRTYPCPHVYEAVGQEQNTINSIS